VVIVGRSNLVGKPQLFLLLRETRHCHDLSFAYAEPYRKCGRGDILVAAIGRPGFITADL
jgi:methylenetetrahydrofolate dehydrogenase (NADP+)/methenyltetrahydrofolate cyclohydrolase